MENRLAKSQSPFRNPKGVLFFSVKRVVPSSVFVEFTPFKGTAALKSVSGF
jgi:hypothetical protein